MPHVWTDQVALARNLLSSLAVVSIRDVNNAASRGTDAFRSRRPGHRDQLPLPGGMDHHAQCALDRIKPHVMLDRPRRSERRTVRTRPEVQAESKVTYGTQSSPRPER